MYLSPRRAAGVKILLRSFPTRTLTLIRGQGCGIHHHCRQQPSVYQRSGWYFPRPRSQPPHLFEHVFFTLFKKVCSFFAAFGDTPGYCNETKRHLRLEDFYVRHIHSTDFISVIKVVNISMYKYITCKGSHGVQSLEKLDEYHMLVQRAPFTLLG